MLFEAGLLNRRGKVEDKNTVSDYHEIENVRETSIFATMSALAQECNAINLSQGFPDFPISQKLIDLVSNYMNKGYNQYAPMTGLPALREQIAIKVEKLYKVVYDLESGLGKHR